MLPNACGDCAVALVENPQRDPDPESVEEEKINPAVASEMSFCSVGCIKSMNQGDETYVYMKFEVSRFGDPLSHSGAKVIKPKVETSQKLAQTQS